MFIAIEQSMAAQLCLGIKKPQYYCGFLNEIWWLGADSFAGANAGQAGALTPWAADRGTGQCKGIYKCRGRHGCRERLCRATELTTAVQLDPNTKKATVCTVTF